MAPARCGFRMVCILDRSLCVKEGVRCLVINFKYIVYLLEKGFDSSSSLFPTGMNSTGVLNRLRFKYITLIQKLKKIGSL